MCACVCWVSCALARGRARVCVYEHMSVMPAGGGLGKKRARGSAPDDRSASRLRFVPLTPECVS